MVEQTHSLDGGGNEAVNMAEFFGDTDGDAVEVSDTALQADDATTRTDDEGDGTEEVSSDDVTDGDEITFSDESDSLTVESALGRITDEPVREMLQGVLSDFESQKAGFDKIHEQVKDLRKITGFSSLKDVAKQYAEQIIPLNEALSDMASDDADIRDHSVRFFVGKLQEKTGLDVEDILEIASGIGSPGVKPSAAINKEDALRVLGISEEVLEQVTQLQGFTEFDKKYGKAIKATSAKLGFEIDPQAIYKIKLGNPSITDEAALIAAHPKEYKAYLSGNKSRPATDTLQKPTAPSGKVDYGAMSHKERAQLVTQMI